MSTITRTPSVAAIEAQGFFFWTVEAEEICHYVKFMYGNENFVKTTEEVKALRVADVLSAVFKRRPGSWTHNIDMDSEEEFLDQRSS